jgi:prophage regulatory protein
MADIILRLPQVKARVGLSRSSIYLRINNGEFPAPISLGARAVGWLESEIDAWPQARIEASEKPIPR